MDNPIIDIDEGQRQLILLSLAICSKLRPGFDYALSKIAAQMHGLDMYDDFKKMQDE